MDHNAHAINVEGQFDRAFTRENLETFQKLKTRLLFRSLRNSENRHHAALRRASDEAAALAWQTGHPLLWFPALWEEKQLQARMYVERQRMIRDRSMNHQMAA